MNVELTSMLWGGLSGAAMFALGLYWLWDMKPSNAETEWLRSEIKGLRGDMEDLRRDVEDLDDEYNELAKRVHAIEHPPFEPKFGDRVMAERVDKSGMSPAMYVCKMGSGQHRVLMQRDDRISEFDTEKVEPLDD